MIRVVSSMQARCRRLALDLAGRPPSQGAALLKVTERPATPPVNHATGRAKKINEMRLGGGGHDYSPLAVRTAGPLTLEVWASVTSLREFRSDGEFPSGTRYDSPVIIRTPRDPAVVSWVRSRGDHPVSNIWVRLSTS